MFESILGNEPIKAYLRTAVEKERLPHALLFLGIDGIGKSLFAKDLAIFLLGDSSRIHAEIHPDFHVIRPEGKSGLHAVETLRQIIDAVHQAPFEAKSKVFLIHDAHRMQPAAAHTLLKTLEEPPSDTLFILLTNTSQEMLPTVVSRCTVLRFQPLSESEIGIILKEKRVAERWSKLAHGSAGKAFDLAHRMKLEESLFRLLAERPIYPRLVATLAEIEKEAESENPVKHSENVEHVFSYILMWHRDQIARPFGIPLFFPDAPIAQYPLRPLHEMEKIVSEAKLAFSRNIRFSFCLEKIFTF